MNLRVSHWYHCLLLRVEPPWNRYGSWATFYWFIKRTVKDQVSRLKKGQENKSHLKSPLKNLFGFGSTHGAVDGDLLVPPDAERPDGVAGLREDGGLPGELLEDLGSASQTITTLSNANVQAKLPDLQIPHRVFQFCFGDHFMKMLCGTLKQIIANWISRNCTKHNTESKYLIKVNF